jgi:branched-subunit amino acid transport protein
MSVTTSLLALVLCGLATYACRALGVLLSSRVSQSSAVFQWVSCVTYAMIAALTSRMIFLPSGVLANVPVWMRLLICGIAIVIMHSGRRNGMVLSLTVGVVLICTYAYGFL